MTIPAPKKSRRYLEEEWLPFLGRYAPVLDIGKAVYTEHYPQLVAQLVGAAEYVSVDRSAEKRPDLVADATAPGFVELARARHAEYGAVIFNGLIGYGIDTLDAIEASLRAFWQLLREGGHLLVGWNEREIFRGDLSLRLREIGFAQQLIRGVEVFEPEETEGFEHLQHHYMHWVKPVSGGERR